MPVREGCKSKKVKKVVWGPLRGRGVCKNDQGDHFASWFFNKNMHKTQKGDQFMLGRGVKVEVVLGPLFKTFLFLHPSLMDHSPFLGKRGYPLVPNLVKGGTPFSQIWEEMVSHFFQIWEKWY